MNEDDTFNALRQTPFHQMRHLLINDAARPLHYLNLDAFPKILKAHGWTQDEYNAAWDKHMAAGALNGYKGEHYE